jgi:chromate transporter
MMAPLWDAAGLHGLGAADLFGLFLHFLVISLLAVGGAISTAADMHRYVVVEHGWLTDTAFTSSIAIAQAAPGPNVLFVAVIGWNVAGVAGVVATMTGILLPSTLLTMAVSRWGAQRPQALWLRAFTLGLGPLTIGLLLSTGWVLAEPVATRPAGWALVIGTVVVMSRKRWSPLWLIALGGLVGAVGWV